MMYRVWDREGFVLWLKTYKQTVRFPTRYSPRGSSAQPDVPEEEVAEDEDEDPDPD